MDTNTAQYPIARKEHTCNWCSQKIKIGETYRKQTIFAEGSAYTWKNHNYCTELAEKLKMFEAFDYGDGLSESDFCDCITEEFRDIMYESDSVTYNSANPMPHFSERMKIVREKYNL